MDEPKLNWVVRSATSMHAACLGSKIPLEIHYVDGSWRHYKGPNKFPTWQEAALSRELLALAEARLHLADNQRRVDAAQSLIDAMGKPQVGPMPYTKEDLEELTSREVRHLLTEFMLLVLCSSFLHGLVEEGNVAKAILGLWNTTAQECLLDLTEKLLQTRVGVERERWVGDLRQAYEQVLKDRDRPPTTYTSDRRTDDSE